MKLLKTIYLIFGILFAMAFIYSLFDPKDTHKLLFWNVNIWIYRGYLILIVILFTRSYLSQKTIKKL
jgi:hypothetical protein